MTFLLTLLARSHGGETSRERTPWSQTSTLILPFSAFLSLRTFLTFSHRRSHRVWPPHTRLNTQTHTGKIQVQFWELSLAWGPLFSGCVVPKAAILPWPPLLLSKPCNQCAALCTRMSQDAAAEKKKKAQQNFRWTAVAQSSTNQVLLASPSFYVRPFEANKVFAVWHIVLGSHKAAVGSIRKVSRGKNQSNQ